METIIYEQLFKGRIDEDYYQSTIQLVLIETNELIYKVVVKFENDDYNHELEKEIYRGKTIRNSKREDVFLDALTIHVNQICDVLGGIIYLDSPLSEAKYL